eukprot:COSAG05_NODE_2964_length_2459_cov_2.441525_2_plen_59_part_00
MCVAKQTPVTGTYLQYTLLHGCIAALSLKIIVRNANLRLAIFACKEKAKSGALLTEYE